MNLPLVTESVMETEVDIPEPTLNHIINSDTIKWFEMKERNE